MSYENVKTKCKFKWATYICLLISLLFISSCKHKSGTVVDYIHEETIDFYKNKDFNDKKLKPYKINDMIFAPYIVGRNNQYVGSLRVYSKYPVKSEIIVNINKAVLYKNSEEDENAIQEQIEKEIKINEKYRDSNIYRTVVFFFWELTGTMLEELSQDGHIHLAVYCSVEKDNETVQKRFEYILKMQKRKGLIRR